jgi:hypothetical protein
MSTPNRESVAKIARSIGNTAQTLNNWRAQWQKQGELVPATTRPPEQWGVADKLAAVIKAAGLGGPELRAFSVRVAFTPGSFPAGGRPPKMPMAPALRARLISRNFSAKIRNRLARFGACNANWRRKKKHYRRQQHY